MSDSLQPHGLQHARPPCPSPTPGVYSNSCLLSQWCHSTILSSVVPLFSHLQFFPACSGLISFRMDWLDLLAIQGTLKSLLQHHSSKASVLWCSAFFIVQLLHPYVTTERTIALIRWTFGGKVMSLLFNMLSRLVISFLPRSNHLLISWLQSTSAVILEPPKIKSVIVSTLSPSICHELMGTDAVVLVFWMLSFKLTFSLSYFTFIKTL